MTFEEIKADKNRFLKLNGIEEQFNKSGYSWDDLIAIGFNYEQKAQNEFFHLIQRYIAEISKFENVHSYRYRIKSTESLLVKIITKYKNITINNYFKKITDLLGIRILYIFKSDYLSIHRQIMEKYGDQKAENVHLKLRDGDDKNTYSEMLSSDDIKVERNNVYRSIHYTIYALPKDINSSPKLEIQTRTIFEEGWSEINHKLVYKQSSKSKSQLEIVSKILSELVGSCDSMGSLMQYIENVGETGMEDTVGEVLKRFLKK